MNDVLKAITSRIRQIKRDLNDQPMPGKTFSAEYVDGKRAAYEHCAVLVERWTTDAKPVDTSLSKESFRKIIAHVEGLAKHQKELSNRVSLSVSTKLSYASYANAYSYIVSLLGRWYAINDMRLPAESGVHCSWRSIPTPYPSESGPRLWDTVIDGKPRSTHWKTDGTGKATFDHAPKATDDIDRIVVENKRLSELTSEELSVLGQVLSPWHARDKPTGEPDKRTITEMMNEIPSSGNRFGPVLWNPPQGYRGAIGPMPADLSPAPEPAPGPSGMVTVSLSSEEAKLVRSILFDKLEELNASAKRHADVIGKNKGEVYALIDKLKTLKLR